MNKRQRNPPASGQFKKGRSGNPNGRPKKKDPVTIDFLFYKVATGLITIEVNGNKIKMMRWEALVRQLQTLSLKKNASAARLLRRMRKMYPGSAPTSVKYLCLASDADMAL